MLFWLYPLGKDGQVLRQKSSRKGSQRWYTAFAGLLLIGIIAFLLGLNYQGQWRLQQEAMRFLQVDLAARSDAISYFVMERMSDMEKLTSNSNAAATFFINKSLGMSMEYGLRGSLNLVYREFDSLSETTAFGGEAIWSRLVLFSNEGSQILESFSPQKDLTQRIRTSDSTILPCLRSVSLESGTPSSLRFTSPVIRNGNQLGCVAGWVNLETLNRQFLQTEKNSKKVSSSLDSIVLYGADGEGASLDRGIFQLAGALMRLVEADSTTSAENATSGIRFMEDNLPGISRGVVAVYQAVTGLDAMLIRFVDRKNVDDAAKPMRYLIVLTMFSMGVIGVIVLIVRFSTKALVFEERLVEANRKKDQIQRINTNLQAEIQSRKKAENELAQEKAFLHSLIEAIPDPIFYMDRRLRYTGSNPAFLRLFAGSENNPGDNSPFEIFGNQTAKLLEQQCQEILLTGKTVQDEYWVDLYEGESLLLDVKITPHKTEEGGSAGLICIGRDITRRKQMEIALDSQRERLDLVIRGTHIGVWDWNIQTGETVFNDRWAEIVGYTLDELTPVSIETWLELAHPDDLEQTSQLLEKHFNGELDLYDCECRMRHKAGHWVWVHDRGRVMEWTKDGLPLRMSGTHSDISSRKAAEEKFKESQERLITAIEALDDGFVLYDADDRLVLHNKRYLEIYKESAEFITIGERFEDILRKGLEKGQYADAVGREKKWLAERMVQHLSPSSTIEQKLADGTWLRISERRTRDGGVVGFRVDITDLKKVESQLREINETLEERVQDRAARLKEMHAQMVLQEKMASVGLLAAGMAHELNNPINFVNGNFVALTDYIEDITEIIQNYRSIVDKSASSGWDESLAIVVREKEKELQIDYILDDLPMLFEESRRGFDRIVRIIDSMRAFSHVDHTGQFVPSDINKCIQDTLVIARSSYKYCADVDENLGDIPQVVCLPEQLNQVFLNLIINGAQAIEMQKRSEKGRIEIRTWLENAMVCCEISDDGPGVPEDIRNRIFEPFFTTKPPGKGTGLGLSICYDIIVEKHKGKLALTCPQNGGSVFTIQLPPL
ncbi:PAS domain S-box protein [Desulfopila aestuarii]|uniref:histidine kinase n=1 Tax=Desulfopila aestuarii DSM 18488 TaxID=1121416 RepID=A0A1M7YG62_9BACT|nr:PAS domain S-box protein [Desulfopila aestuarii]SHO51610.1 PAS domain S-box-containing protein [Desulfopila aestuarii DSM 18488]